jgi:hypothetical protein
VTTFKRYDEVAVIECDPQTGEPLEGCVPRYGTVIDAGRVVSARIEGSTYYFLVDSRDRAWAYSRHLQLVPLCARPGCGKPVLAPVSDPEDRAGRTWCSEGCLEADAEASHEQRYQPGVAT